MEFAEQLAPVLAGLAADGVHVHFLPRVADELRVRVEETSDCDMCVLDTSGLEHFLASAVSQATGQNLSVRVIERRRIAGPKEPVSPAEDW